MRALRVLLFKIRFKLQMLWIAHQVKAFQRELFYGNVRLKYKEPEFKGLSARYGKEDVWKEQAY